MSSLITVGRANRERSMDFPPEANGDGSNGKLRLSNQERIYQLHKKLHNEKTNENIIEPQNNVSTKPPRIRRTDVRKYLGDPLPLPYLTTSRAQPLETKENGVNIEVTQSRKHLQMRKPLGRNKAESFDDVYKDKLRNSLKNFQVRSSSRGRRSTDLAEQTIKQQQEEQPSTPNSKMSLVNTERDVSYYDIKGKSPSAVILKTLTDKDMVISEFKQRNKHTLKTIKNSWNNSSDDVSSKVEQKLQEPFIPKKQHVRRDRESQYIHIHLISILGSPILLFGLMIFLHFLLKDFLLQL